MTTVSDTRGTQFIPLSLAAEQFHVSVKTLRRRIADGTITGYRLGRLIRVDAEEVTARLLVAMPSVVLRQGRRA